jgi:hypothetical protein
MADDEAKVSILVVNPQDTDIKSPVIYYLPPEIKPENIVDAQGMEVKYDNERQTYYLSKEVELAPRETKKIAVTIKNVWTISAEDISQVREMLTQRVKGLAGTKYEATSALLLQKVNDKLDTIESDQKRVRDNGEGLRRQIEIYRANAKQLEQIKQDIVSVDSIRRLESESKTETPTIRFMISAENPSDEAKSMMIQSVLPSEITADDILNKLDFDLTYDQDRKQFSLEKTDSFAAKETKKYTITIRNIWQIPNEELNRIQEQMDRLLNAFKGSPFEIYSRQSGEFVIQSLKEIRELQVQIAESSVIEDHQRAYTLNSQRLFYVKNRIKELQDLLLEVQEKSEDNKIEQMLSQFLKKMQKIREKLLTQLGYKPDKVTTWYIIFGICAFLAVLAVAFYLIWLKQIQKESANERLQKK